MQLVDILNQWEPEVARSNRASILRDIIALCNTPQETKLIKLKNIERYKKWLSENKLRHSIENSLKFKKHKTFIKPPVDKAICIMLGHVKTDDLYLVYSTCRDLSFRGKSVRGYIYGLAYPKDIHK